MSEFIQRKVKQQFKVLGFALCAMTIIASLLTGCSLGKSDEAVIGELAQKFMVALYTSNKDLAKEICNKTGYETFETLSGMIAMGSMGMNQQLDESVIVSKVDVIEVKMINENKGVATVMSTLGDKPAQYAIPAEKDADGNWKICVTKQSFN